MLDNTISIMDETEIKSAYNKRNYVYKMYIEDIVYKSLLKLSKRNDLSKILINKISNLSLYKGSIDAAVNNKFKEIQEKVGDKALYTLEPLKPELIETNMDLLSGIYGGLSESSMVKISPVKKELSETVANITFDLLDVIKNKIGNYIKEYSTEVKSIVKSLNKEQEEDIEINFLNIQPVTEVIIDNGIINKYYSGNFKYQIDIDYDSSDVIDVILNTNYEDIDLLKFDMEVDGEVKNYIEELDNEIIDDFKNIIEEKVDSHLSMKAFIREIAGYNIPIIKDLDTLILLWVGFINGYIKNNDKRYSEIAAYIEKEIKNSVTKINELEKDKVLAITNKNGSKFYIYIVLKEYLNTIEKYKDIVNVLKGYVVNTNSLNRVKLDMLKDKGFNLLLDNYDRYLANKRYKETLARINDLRDAYIYGFNKTNSDFLELIDGNYDILSKVSKLVREYIYEFKIDELLNVDNTVYKIIKKLIFNKLLSIINSYIELGEKRFPDDEDDALIFAIILTLTEVTFSLFRVKVLDRVE